MLSDRLNQVRDWAPFITMLIAVGTVMATALNSFGATTKLLILAFLTITIGACFSFLLLRLPAPRRVLVRLSPVLIGATVAVVVAFLGGGEVARCGVRSSVLDVRGSFLAATPQRLPVNTRNPAVSVRHPVIKEGSYARR